MSSVASRPSEILRSLVELVSLELGLRPLGGLGVPVMVLAMMNFVVRRNWI
jgi:hypothetical protein